MLVKTFDLCRSLKALSIPLGDTSLLPRLLPECPCKNLQNQPRLVPMLPMVATWLLVLACSNLPTPMKTADLMGS